MSIDSPAIRPESADAPVRNDAWILHSQGRRFGPLTEDEMRGYFRAGMVKAGDSIEMPGAPAAVTAEAVATLLGMPAPVAGPAATPLPTSIVFLPPQESRSGGLVIAVALVAIIGVAGFAIYRMLQLPSADELATATPAAVHVLGPADAPVADAPVVATQSRPAAAPASAAAPAEAVAALAPQAAEGPAAPPATHAVGTVPDDFWSRAASLATAQDWSALLAHAGHWTTAEPASERAWWYLGLANMRLGSLGEAETAYLKVLQISPGHFDARWSLSNVYLRTNRHRDAGQLLQELVREQPGNAGAWQDLGVAMAGSGEFDDAVAAYEKALQIAPNYRLAWSNLAHCYARFGYMDRAKVAAANANSL